MMDMMAHEKLVIQQVCEPWELLGFETGNKYVVLSEEMNRIGFIAEQQKSFLGHFLRQYLGHWRSFEIHFYNAEREIYMHAKHPFRFFFQRLEVSDARGVKLGSLQQKFSLISKKFDIFDENDNIIMQMRSPLWKPWTYPFYSRDRVVARVLKKFTGVLTELFTDRDNYLIEFRNKRLIEKHRKVILATSVFIDLLYFEKKAGR